MCTQPRPKAKHNAWNVVSEQLDSGLWRYRVDGSYERGTVRAAINATAVAVGDVLVLVYECDAPTLLVGLNSGSVSYTHLTLPTTSRVYVGVGGGG